MRSRAALVAALTLGLGAAGFAPAAAAGHVVIGIGLPGLAIAVPAPLPAFAPPYFYAPAYVGAPWYGGWYGRGFGYYGRPYLHLGPRGPWRGYGGHRYH